MNKVMFQPEKCSGCWACTMTCEDQNDICMTSVSMAIRTVEECETKTDGEYKFSYKMRGCMHCENPICKSVCPKHCFSVSENGLVILDDTNCVGCKLCAKACAFEAIVIKDKKASKCNGCAGRLAAGLRPSCEKICPTGALYFDVKAKCEFNHTVVE